MDYDDYRRLQQRIVLSAHGAIPMTALDLTQEECDAILGRIAGIRDLLNRSILFPPSPSHIPQAPTPMEIWLGFRRWGISHHLFIPLMALNGYCFHEALEASGETERQKAEDWLTLASRIRKACGALFLYGVDFQPCTSIYCAWVRSKMPPGFSGSWIREHHEYFQPALVRFLGAYSENGDASAKETLAKWMAADCRYHDLHRLSMRRAVGDGKSLAAIYTDENKKAHEVGEAEFRCYDNWFSIDRRDDTTRLDYLFQICDLMERALVDLTVGRRLEASVTSDLFDGMRATLAVFGKWVAPEATVPPESRGH